MPELNASGDKLLFYLSPNDLVYVPGDINVDNYYVNKNNVYKVVSCTGNELHCVPHSIASPILQTRELGSNNKAQRTWEGDMIKEVCIPLKVDRLGNITYIGTKFLPKRK